jgi:glucose-specific phosphotransferase system IIA component
MNMSKILSACVNGEIKPLSSVSDPVFSQGMLGEGVAITPSDGLIVAPCDGVISMMFPTHHAFGITSDGLDILIHIGIDTVGLNGKHFMALVKEGDHVKRHQVCVKCDLDKIKENKLSTDTMMVITEKPKEMSLTLYDEIRHVSIEDTVISYK